MNRQPIDCGSVITHKRDCSVGLATFGLYILISLIYFARALPFHPGNSHIGRDTDPPQTIWFFNWWRYSLSARSEPVFFTRHGLGRRSEESTWRGPPQSRCLRGYLSLCNSR